MNRSIGSIAWKPSCSNGDPAWRLYPVVQALQALRGVQWLVAITVVAELGDLTRCENPRPRAAFVGLTPSAYSSGSARRQGGITKTGNGRARRALVEGAWAYRHPAKVSEHIQRRIDALPKPIQDIGWTAQVRLCKRFRRLVARGKHPNVAVTAIARELIAFMWAIAKAVPVPACVRVCVLSGRRRGAAPVCRAPLDDVKRRLRPTLVPRPRQARDGSQSGGTQPTDLSRINRRCDLAPPRRWPGCVHERSRARALICENRAGDPGSLDNRSHINGPAHPRAAQRQNRSRRVQPDVMPSVCCRAFGREVTRPSLVSVRSASLPPGCLETVQQRPGREAPHLYPARIGGRYATHGLRKVILRAHCVRIGG